MRAFARIAIFGGALCCDGALALDAGKVDAVEQAMTQFTALAVDSHVTGNAPRRSSAEAARLLSVVCDAVEAEKLKVTSMDEFVRLGRWALSVGDVGPVYLRSGTGTKELSGVPEEKAQANALKYANEMGPCIDTAVWLGRASIVAVRTIVDRASDEQRKKQEFRDWVTRLRSGMAQMFNGTMFTIAVEGLDNDWIELRLKPMREIAPLLGWFAVPEHRKRLHASSTTLGERTKNPKLKQAFAEFAKIFEPK